VDTKGNAFPVQTSVIGCNQVISALTNYASVCISFGRSNTDIVVSTRNMDASLCSCTRVQVVLLQIARLSKKSW
jgi:hypothetical protein